MFNGHREADILSYSMPKIQAFVELIRARQAKEQGTMAYAFRMAQGASTEDFAKYMESLDRG